MPKLYHPSPKVNIATQIHNEIGALGRYFQTAVRILLPVVVHINTDNDYLNPLVLALGEHRDEAFSFLLAQEVPPQQTFSIGRI